MRKRVLVVAGAVLVVIAVAFILHANGAGGDNPTATATPNQLWPPNHRMVPIQLDVFCDWEGSCTRENPCACCQKFHIVSVKSHEPLSTEDYVIDNSTRPPALLLKAERLGDGSGRSYIVEMAEDAPICCRPGSFTTTVFVPHDQRK